MRDRLGNLASASAAGNRQRSWRSVFLAFACAATVVASAYFLVVPAMTMSGTAYCGSEAHEHDAGCFIEVLQCDFDAEVTGEVTRSESHQHDDDCYEIQKAPICGFEGLEASAGGEGFSEGEPHVHAESCYEQESVLVCDLAAADAVENDGALAEAHVHTDACRAQILNCDIKEHKHVLACFSNPDADLETAADWESTLPGEGEFSGVWADDLILVAESQLGYAESDTNYVVTDDETKKGYTRYGAWYGNAYGDWCAMFVAFCLEYAGIPESSIPRDSSCQNWIEVMASEEYQMFYPVGAYAEEVITALDGGLAEINSLPSDVLTYFDPSESFVPVPGDIVFFDWDSNVDSDHVGIVVEVTEGFDGAPVKIKTIEGNASDQVKYCEYEFDDASIMGYGMLPIKLEGEAVTLESGSGGVSLLSDSSSIVPTGQGYYYGMNQKYFYQDSSHRIDGGLVTTFLLVDDDLKGENVTLTPGKGTEWTAKSSSNFIVAYCCDLDTSVGTSPVDFTSYLLEESRISDPALQAKLSAIIAHSYPFISSADMKAELEAANVGCCSDCGANEYLAAVQWAIWELTTLGGDMNGATESKFGLNESNVHNRLSSVGHTQSSEISSHVEAIKEYLVELPAYAGMLEISSYKNNLSQNSDGTYTLSVAITLNRAMRGDESLSAYLQAGSKRSETTAVQAGASQVVITVSGITENELYDAEVNLVGTGAHMQAYFFDSEDKQDMLGGRWETYPLDLSFELSRDTTSVSVTKSWADDGDHPDSVSVQLVRNGVDYGEPVTLSDASGWGYSWTELPKYDCQDVAYEYKVRELVPAGYSSSVTDMQESGMTTQVWKAVDTFSAGKTYMLVSSIGALGAGSSSSSKLTWGAYALTPASETANLVRWTVSANGDGWVLTNQANGKKLNLSNSSVSYSNSGSTFYLSSDKKLYGKSGSGYNKINRYLTGIEDGTGKTTSDSSKATVLTLYELQTVEVAATGQSFLITNTPIETTSITVEKRWVDSDDPYRPESVQVSLLADGRFLETATIGAASNWTYTWNNLPIHDSAGKVISYSVEELEIEGYDVGIVADDGYFLITNTKSYFVLPETGGVGAGALVALGIGLLGIFAASFVIQMRNKEEA